MVKVSAMNAIEDEYPFDPHFMTTTSGRLHYIDEGPRDAPPLLMLHGNPTWSFYYRHLVRGLSDTYRVIVPDHLGCGLSDKPKQATYTLRGHIDRLAALVEHLSLTDITLVVHDWGGAIGMGFAVEHPERIGRFVVFNTAAFPSPHMPWQIGLCRIPGFGALAIRGFNAFVLGALMTCSAHPERLTDTVKAGYLGAVQHVGEPGREPAVRARHPDVAEPSELSPARHDR